MPPRTGKLVPVRGRLGEHLVPVAGRAGEDLARGNAVGRLYEVDRGRAEVMTLEEPATLLAVAHDFHSPDLLANLAERPGSHRARVLLLRRCRRSSREKQCQRERTCEGDP